MSTKDSSNATGGGKDGKDGPRGELQVPQVCHLLQRELHNMGRALTCTICQSTYRDPVVSSKCTHMFCRSCFQRALATSSDRCPICKIAVNRRSFTGAPVEWLILIDNYKALLRHCGLAPIRYEPTLFMTQDVRQTDFDNVNEDDFQQAQDDVQLSRVFCRVFESDPETYTGATIQEQRQVVESNEQTLERMKRIRQEGPLPPSITQLMAEDQDLQAANALEEWQIQQEQGDEMAIADRQVKGGGEMTNTESQDSFYSAQEAIEESSMTGLRQTLAKAMSQTNGDDPNDSERLTPEDERKMPARNGTERQGQGAMSTVHEDDESTVDPDGMSEQASSEERRVSFADDISSEIPEPSLPIASGASATMCDTRPEVPQISIAASPLLSKKSNNFQNKPAEMNTGGSSPSATSMTSNQDSTTENPSSSPNRETPIRVGTVVQVEARTWPGINKPGGIGRVSAIHLDESGNTSYDVYYVLGGREKQIDAAFVSVHTASLGSKVQVASGRTREEKGSSSRRTGRKSCRLERKEQEEIPSTLLKQLAKEGFDTAGKVPLAPAGRAVAPSVAARSHSKENSEPTCNRKKRGRSILDFIRPAKRKRRQQEATGDSVSQKKAPRTSLLSSPSASGAQNFELADDFYATHFAAASRKGVISVVASSLSEVDMERLHALCKGTKRRPIKVKLSDKVSNKTTVCLLPVRNAATDPALTGARRTLKSMRACLRGIPIVSPDWIEDCLKTKRIECPKASMYVRSLPSPSSDGVVESSFGVAVMAATLSQSPAFKPLSGVAAYVVGSFPKKIDADIRSLMRESGMTILAGSASVLKHLRSEERVVFLDGESGKAKISAALRKQIDLDRGRVSVVNSQWLYDCISVGFELGAAAYEPRTTVAKELLANIRDAP